MAPMVVPNLVAIAVAVSPERTAYLTVAGAAGVAAAGALCAVAPGIESCCPLRSRHGLASMLAFAIALIVVPYLAAIAERVSPERTVCAARATAAVGAAAAGALAAHTVRSG